MVQNNFLKFVCISVLSVFVFATAHAEDESITYDSNSGSYIYRYRGYDIFDDGRMIDLGIIQGIFTPAKITPRVISTFYLNHELNISYRYTVINNPAAKQLINQFTFLGMPTNALIVGGNNNETVDPAGWNGSFNGGSVRWMPTGDIDIEGISPGNRTSGFGFTGVDLPGIVQAELSGEGDASGFEDSNSGPAETSPLRVQDDLIHHEDYKPYPVAAPIVVVPKPFDAAVVVENIRIHIATWPNFKTGGYNGNVPPDKRIFLLDATYASQLDRYLAAAAEAFHRNQLKAGREHLETIHELLEKEHKHLDSDNEANDERQDKEHRAITRPNIDRLAARVLDFDVKYVLKRLEEKSEKKDN